MKKRYYNIILIFCIIFALLAGVVDICAEETKREKVTVSGNELDDEDDTKIKKELKDTQIIEESIDEEIERKPSDTERTSESRVSDDYIKILLVGNSFTKSGSHSSGRSVQS